MREILFLKVKSKNGVEWKSKGSLDEVEKDFINFMRKKR
jgi:hypothetical protein